MSREQQMSIRKQFIDEMENHFLKDNRPEDRMFYCHPDEDRIVLSHALFWVMTRSLEKLLPVNKCFLLLRMYQEEMLEAYLTESEEYPELLRYCNVAYELLPYEISTALKNPKISKHVRKLSALATVAAGYGGDMPEYLACELLNDMDFSFNKVSCPKIELILPQLYKMVEKEFDSVDLSGE